MISDLGGGHKKKSEVIKKSASHRLLPSPEQQYEPATPAWMQEYAAICNGEIHDLKTEEPTHIYAKIVSLLMEHVMLDENPAGLLHVCAVE